MKINKKGFSFIELIVVVAIIGLLVAIASVGYGGVQKSARDAKKIQDLNAIQRAMEMAFNQGGETYPLNSNALLSTGTLDVWPIVPKTDPPEGYALYSNGITYCSCIWLEMNKGGNSTDYDGDAVCSFLTSDPAQGKYYCIKNQQ